MFYLPFKLRNQTEYTTPKGPSFKWSPKIDISIDGTTIRLRAPRHRTVAPAEPRHPRRTYHLAHIHLDAHSMGRPEWRSLPLIYRVWDFYGPWFIGRISNVYMTLSIVTPESIRETSSFFHPRAFESGIADYLTYFFKEEVLDGKQRWVAPYNWQPIKHLSSNAVSFDVVEDKAFETGSMTRFLCKALSNHHLLVMGFTLSQNAFLPKSGEEDKRPHEWINNAPMKALADQVINSLEVKLSAEAQAQQAQALIGLEDTSLIKEFPPLKWV